MKPQPKLAEVDELSKSALKAFDNLNGGSQAGYRPVHAKGILLSGTFTPATGVSNLTRAPHVARPSIPVAVRFSDFAGIPTVADNDSENASPRGIAIRFYLAEHSHTDIVAHSVDGFPARTAEEFVEFLGAIYQSGPGAPKPTPIEKFLGSHPAALEFVQTPKPIPASFANETFFAITAYKFTNSDGTSKFGRYRIVPEAGSQYLSDSDAAQKTPNFLFDEIRERISAGPIRMKIEVQVAANEDVVDDATKHWPKERPVVEFGTVEINAITPEGEAAQRQIIFDPIPRVDGIESSGDPLLEPRAALYLVSGRRRRADGPQH